MNPIQAQSTARNKIQPRSVLLRSDVQVSMALNIIGNLPLDDKKPIEVLIRENPRVRGLDQNGYYHMRIGEIAEQAFFGGRQFSHEVWHEHAKQEIMPEEIITKDGGKRSKWIEMPNGKLTVISTTQLEKACFAEYTTMVEAFGASLGVQFSARRSGK